jgi:threonine aldolase
MSLIDLRSDTVTRPVAAMREAMARAEVGDDVYGEDPTVRVLETKVAELLGKEAALFVPSGTMSNQIALLCHARRGDEVYIGEGAHVAFNESGAGAAWAGVQFVEVGRGGTFTADELAEVIKPDVYYLPRPRVVAIENTHNRAGGCVFPQPAIEAIAEVARGRGLALHLDGARIWNAAAASGLAEHQLAAPFDSVSICFSKGLGAPVGSALVGSSALVTEARRFRKMLGGGMRQAGILAAGALYAVEHHRARIVEDHVNAALFASGLAAISKAARVGLPETNIVNVDVPGDAARVSDEARRGGLLVSPSAPRRLRAVFHLDTSKEDASRAATILAAAIAASEVRAS